MNYYFLTILVHDREFSNFYLQYPPQRGRLQTVQKLQQNMTAQYEASLTRYVADVRWKLWEFVTKIS
jgi:hypothetical protein